ncbi:MAG: amidohydrolase [Ignavibacteriaceae bacterium]
MNLSKLIILSIIMLLTISTNAQLKRTAFVNGKIYTVNENQLFAQSVIVEGNKILFVGSDKDANKYIDKTTKVIDLKGKLMLPGFIDGHTHFINGGFNLIGLKLHDLTSKKDFVEAVKNYVKGKEGRWITGGRWDHESWDDKTLPTKEMIDPFTQNTPVFLKRYDGHMGLANTYALKLAGIIKNTPSPEGGLIVKDPETGEPTGILKDNAMDLVDNIIPEYSDVGYSEALTAALNEAKRFGVTSIEDMSYTTDESFQNQLRTYQNFEKEGKLTVRVATRMPINTYEKLIKAGVEYNFGDNFITLGSLKAYADGSLGSSSAWFFEPYVSDKNNYGLPNDIFQNGNFEKWSLYADKHKLQICVHAIGDKAVSSTLDAVEKMEKENPNWDRRFHIEHSQHLRAQDIPRFAKLGVIASVQPTHLMEDGNWAEKRIGKERLKYMHPYNSFLKAGVIVDFGTDFPVVTLNPMVGLYMAVTRRTSDGKNPNGLEPQEKISIEQAIKCYTLNSAYAEYQENKKGSIEPGKLADLVVLDKDILTIDPVKIKDVKVAMTVLGGKVIYKAE